MMVLHGEGRPSPAIPRNPHKEQNQTQGEDSKQGTSAQDSAVPAKPSQAKPTITHSYKQHKKKTIGRNDAAPAIPNPNQLPAH